MSPTNYQSQSIIWIAGILLIFFNSCTIDEQTPLILENEKESSGPLNGFVLEESIEDFSNFKTGPWNMVYEETFEGLIPFSAYVFPQFPASHSFRTVTSPVLKGSKSGRFELRYGDAMVTDGGGPRAEILLKKEILNDITGNEAWYSFSVNAPSSGFSKDGAEDIITQWKTGSGTPTLSMRVKDDQFHLRIGYNSNIKTADWDNYDLGVVNKNQWIQFVFRVIHSSTSTGLVEVWRNGTKLVSHKGPNLYPDSSFPVWKLGIYKPSWSNNRSDTDVRVLFFDNIRVGNLNASFDEMNPSNDNLIGWGPYVPDIKSFTLINTITKQIIGVVPTGSKINIKPLKDNRITLRANFDEPFAGSVEFNLTGPKTHLETDNTFPFTLYGESSSGQYYNRGGTPVGSYTLIATPYADRIKSGKMGNPINFKFQVVQEDNNIVIHNGSVLDNPTVEEPIEEEVNPTSGLVGYWSMDETSGSTLNDQSGIGNHGIIKNVSGISRVSGKKGLAIDLTGHTDRFATVPHHSSLNISDALTISAWIKPEGISRRQILSKGGPDGYELSIFENGKIEFRINRESSGTSYRLQSNQNYPTNGTWIHVAVTFDGTNSKLYINGIQDNSMSFSSVKIKTNTSPIQIGARNESNRWRGSIDELKLFNKALIGSEILSLVK
jgi:hypothetical protein